MRYHVPREVNRAVVKSERTETTLRRGIAHGERERGGRGGERGRERMLPAFDPTISIS